jgi:hypothetical protein
LHWVDFLAEKYTRAFAERNVTGGC